MSSFFERIHRKVSIRNLLEPLELPRSSCKLKRPYTRTHRPLHRLNSRNERPDDLASEFNTWLQYLPNDCVSVLTSMSHPDGLRRETPPMRLTERGFTDETHWGDASRESCPFDHRTSMASKDLKSKFWTISSGYHQYYRRYAALDLRQTARQILPNPTQWPFVDFLARLDH